MIFFLKFGNQKCTNNGKWIEKKKPLIKYPISNSWRGQKVALISNVVEFYERFDWEKKMVHDSSSNAHQTHCLKITCIGIKLPQNIIMLNVS